MEERNFSFSVRTDEDKKFVSDVKTNAAKQGKKFSWIILQALREYEAKKVKTNVKA